MGADAGASLAPSTGEIQRIAALGDPVDRNFQITDCYHRLSGAMAARTGQGANWCTFATWASRQAGQTIRGEDLRRTLERTLPVAPRLAALLGPVLGTARSLGSRLGGAEVLMSLPDVIDARRITLRVADAVARGNLKVFQEIGYEFARFLSEVDLEDPDPRSVDRFCASLRDGEPPGGQRYLRQAFRRYHRALFELDPRRRAQAMFLANVEIGFHEQTRLQPEVSDALNGALPEPGTVRSRVLSLLFPSPRLLRLRLWFWAYLGRPSPLDHLLERVTAELRSHARRAITEHLMTLELPGRGTLRLGQDLQATFPPALSSLDDPDSRPLMALLDPTPDSVEGTGAVDWAVLGERMHYIADLFRCLHDAPELLGPPLVAAGEAAGATA